MIWKHALILALAPVLLAAAPARVRLAFTHATVIDVTGGAARLDQTVVVAEGRIAAVGPSVEVQLPAGARTIDASGRYLLPGLWDMHVTCCGSRRSTRCRSCASPTE